MPASVLIAAACAVSTPQAAMTVEAVLPTARVLARPVSPPRLFVLPEESGTSYATTAPDGRRQLIAQGMRLVEHPDGSLERAGELLPAASPARALALPDRLGGGYLFYVAGPNSTSFWRADDWPSRLAPLGRLEMRAARVEAGFDRVYVMLEESGEVVALDVATGQALDLGALPPSPAFRSMSFADAWLGAVEVPVRGLLVTFDAGGSWRPAGIAPVSSLSSASGKLVIGSGTTTYSLDSAGQVRETGADRGTDPMFDQALAKLSGLDVGIGPEPAPHDARSPPGKLGRRPLKAAVLHGWPDSPTTAVVVTQGAIGRVRLSDGKPLAVEADVVPAGEKCHGLRLGQGFGFVCGREGGGTTFYAFEPPLGLKPVWSFEEPRFVSASGNGALVVRGGCGRKSSRPVGALPYCIRSPDGRTREILVRGDVGVERVVALADGRIAVLVPPRFDTTGLITLLGAARDSRTVKLRLVRVDRATRRLLGNGLWLDGLQQTGPDEFAGWVAGAETLVGVRISLDGKVRTGILIEEPERSLLSGLYGLVVPKSGTPQQTTDGGRTWRTVEFPWHLDEVPGGTTRDERGCSPVGCAAAGWLRVGWQDANSKGAPLAVVETPPETAIPTSSGGRWRLDCVPTGESTRASSASAGAPALAESSRSSGESATTTSWQPFHGVVPPARTPNELGLDRGLETADVLIHAYLWGVRGADWRQSGQWLVRAADRFGIRDAVWSTRSSRSPWPDALTAQTAFGKSTYGAISSAWRATFEPSGRAAALLIGNELFLLEAGRTIVRVRDPAGSGLTELAGAVKLGDQWYVGAEGTNFTVLRVEGERLGVLGTYPLFAERHHRLGLSATLVRTDSADGLAIWVRSSKVRGTHSRWYLYPLDPVSGAAQDPLELGPAHLGTFPPACGEGDRGYVLDGSPPVSPYVDFDGSGLGVWRLQARLLVSPVGLCTEALAADAQAALPPKLTLPRSTPHGGTAWVSLTVAERNDPTLRRGFRCTP